MANYMTLPDGYKEIFTVNLVEDKKMLLLLNGIAIAIAAVMIIIMALFIPFNTLFDTSNGVFPALVRLATVTLGSFVYILLHEYTHGIFIKKYSGVKAKYGFKGGCAYAGSDAFFDRKSYIVIALAPIVVWGVILLILNLIVPVQWFWVVYIIQVFNVSGAAGDMYVTWKFSKLPDDILVTDSGVAMIVYSRK